MTQPNFAQPHAMQFNNYSTYAVRDYAFAILTKRTSIGPNHSSQKYVTVFLLGLWMWSRLTAFDDKEVQESAARTGHIN